MPFVQRGNEKLCSLKQVRAYEPKAGVFHRVQRKALCSSPAFTGLFLAPQFWLHMVPLGGCCTGWHSTGQQPCFCRSYMARTAPGVRANGQMGLLRTATNRISHHSVLTGQSWGLILCGGHVGVRAAPVLLLPALWQPDCCSRMI